MSSLTDSAEGNNTRWRLNTQGEFVDETASAGWDLANEIVRLKIGDVQGEDTSIHTPSKMAPGSVQLADTSPLETASSITSSPHTPDNQITISHSRGSSTDHSISSSQASSGTGAPAKTMLHSPFKGGNAAEVKERPHSFSGGLSSADLRRLQLAGGPEVTDHLQQQQQHFASTHLKDSVASDDAQFNPEQPSYPSLANSAQRPPQPYDYRPTQHPPTRDDLVQQIDYNIQQRTFNAVSPASGNAPPTPFSRGGSSSISSPLYRQPPRPFPQQNVIPSPTAMGYPGTPGSLSLGNSQQLYDMMLPPHEGMNPAVSRVQQQHNIFPRAHHHSTSDPSALRDAAALTLLNGNMQFNPAMFPAGMVAPPPGMPMYNNQYYRPQDYRPDAAAQAMAARLQAQYTGPYGMVPPPIDPALSSPTSVNGASGPSANNRKLGLYKTELCRSWEEKGSCRYGAKCQFAHGEEELRSVQRHPKYKTEICRTFWVSGSCPYGKRCCFIHTELPQSAQTGAPGVGPSGSDAATPPTDGRTRSSSTNSDPNDSSVSLLARISAKRSQESSTNSSATPVDAPSNFQQFTRPPTGSLRVDTSALDNSLKQQNKSAYPTFKNGPALPAPDTIKPKSPVPVTAGPDLGVSRRSRLEIVGYNRNAKATTPPSNGSTRNSIGGAEELHFTASPAGAQSSGHSYTLSTGESTSSTSSQPRANGHVRAGSAGNWGLARTNNNHMGNSSFPSPGGEQVNSPWSTTELAVGTSRFSDKAWA